MATGKNHQEKKAVEHKRRYAKYGEDRKFEGDDIANIKTELNRHTCAPIESYQPLFKQIHERVGLEQRY